MPSYIKELMMKEVVDQFEKNSAAFISNFDKLSVADLSEFRRQVEKVAGRTMVVKHSMAKKVFANKNISEAEKLLNAQVLVTFGQKEPQVISKTIVEFAKTHQNLVPSGMVLDNKVYGAEFVKQLAKLPSRHELLTQVVVRVKSPMSGLVLTLNQLVRGVVVALNEVKKKKEMQTA